MRHIGSELGGGVPAPCAHASGDADMADRGVIEALGAATLAEGGATPVGSHVSLEISFDEALVRRQPLEHAQGDVLLGLVELRLPLARVEHGREVQVPVANEETAISRAGYQTQLRIEGADAQARELAKHGVHQSLVRGGLALLHGGDIFDHHEGGVAADSQVDCHHAGGDANVLRVVNRRRIRGRLAEHRHHGDVDARRSLLDGCPKGWVPHISLNYGGEWVALSKDGGVMCATCHEHALALIAPTGQESLELAGDAAADGEERLPQRR